MFILSFRLGGIYQRVFKLGLAFCLQCFVVHIMDPQANFPDNVPMDGSSNFTGNRNPSNRGSNIRNVQNWQDSHYMNPESGFIPGANPNRTSGNGPPSEGRNIVQNWQDSHYMNPNPESGFISGATSNRTSRTGHEDILEDGLYSGPGSAAPSLYNLDSGAPSERSYLPANHPALDDPVGMYVLK